MTGLKANDTIHTMLSHRHILRSQLAGPQKDSGVLSYKVWCQNSRGRKQKSTFETFFLTAATNHKVS